MVVPSFNPSNGGLLCSLTGTSWKFLSVFIFEPTEKTFHHRFVPTLTSAAHAGSDVVCSKQGQVVATAILTASI